MTTSHLWVALSKEWSYAAFKILFYFHKNTKKGTENEHTMTAHKLFTTSIRWQSSVKSSQLKLSKYDSPTLGSQFPLACFKHELYFCNKLQHCRPLYNTVNMVPFLATLFPAPVFTRGRKQRLNGSSKMLLLIRVSSDPVLWNTVETQKPGQKDSSWKDKKKKKKAILKFWTCSTQIYILSKQICSHSCLSPSYKKHLFLVHF